ncbi:MAG: insulinase family protein [Alphaproteobacteria bacterium]|nr:insulinase family protein [Alphaproteobacteria bacterium]
MRVLRVLCAPLLCLFLCLPGRGAVAKTFNAETFSLSNGLQVVVVPNHRAPVVSQMIWYKFGAADEKPGESGVAHFLEHLMFKGTEKVPDGAFSLDVKKMGGDDNAFTTQDYTAFYQNVPRARLAKVMEMEADRMKNLTLTEKQVTSERQVIIEERRQRTDNQPQARLQEQMTSALFVNSPYGTPVIGWLSEMEQLTRAEALDYYHTWYAPNNAILVVSGDITAQELKPLAEKYYGAIPAQKIPPRLRPRPAPIVAPVQVTLRNARVGRPVVIKTWRAPRGSDALSVLSDILGGDSTARLYKDLVVERKLATEAGADYDPVSLNETSFSVYASPAPGVSVDKLRAAIDDEIAKIADKGVTGEELKTSQKRALAGFTYYRDSLQGPGTLFGRALCDGFSTDYIEDTPERLQKLTVKDVAEAAKALFDGKDKPVTGLLLPAKGSGNEGPVPRISAPMGEIR